MREIKRERERERNKERERERGGRERGEIKRERGEKENPHLLLNIVMQRDISLWSRGNLYYCPIIDLHCVNLKHCTPCISCNGTTFQLSREIKLLSQDIHELIT